MKEQKRSFHKKRKWACPKCGKIRMQNHKIIKKGLITHNEKICL